MVLFVRLDHNQFRQSGGGEEDGQLLDAEDLREPFLQSSLGDLCTTIVLGGEGGHLLLHLVTDVVQLDDEEHLAG